jgi:hypothetical protein
MLELNPETTGEQIVAEYGTNAARKTCTYNASVNPVFPTLSRCRAHS